MIGQAFDEPGLTEVARQARARLEEAVQQVVGQS
jgi:hypothetical protein